ncbi:hypothetical protein ACGFLS_32395 [Streptomyces abikoensis]|uniref:hypothetical protein n=1 Tax=Streptomyces abikoensis TaxID=97398 RepID=UPI0037145637
MFTGTAAELADREQRARRLADQIAALLNEIEDLGLGPAVGGAVTIPGAGEITCTRRGWIIR